MQNVHGNIINPFAAYIILQTSALELEHLLSPRVKAVPQLCRIYRVYSSMYSIHIVCDSLCIIDIHINIQTYGRYAVYVRLIGHWTKARPCTSA